MVLREEEELHNQEDVEDQVIIPLQVLLKETLEEMEELVEQTTLVVAEVVPVEQEEMHPHLKQEMAEQEQQTILQEVV